MMQLAQQRCFHHSSREAVARCPACGRCFCRECVTEHEDRVVCAACLKRLTRPKLSARAGVRRLRQAAAALAGLAAGWMFFHLIAQALMLIPEGFHEGTAWRASVWEDE